MKGQYIRTKLARRASTSGPSWPAGPVSQDQTGPKGQYIRNLKLEFDIQSLEFRIRVSNSTFELELPFSRLDFGFRFCVSNFAFKLRFRVSNSSFIEFDPNVLALRASLVLTYRPCGPVLS